MKKRSRCARLILSSAAILYGALFADQAAMLQPTRLIDAQTAGVLPKATYTFETRIYASGDTGIRGNGLCLGISIGITDRLNVGVSYGGDGLIGRGRARGNPYPGAFIKYRVIEESYILPAIALGYDHQGYGGIDPAYKGYVYKSPGFFVALSKNYLLFSSANLGFHGGVNFSLEELSKVKWPDGYIGLDIAVNQELAAAVEYDLGLNARDPRSTRYFNPLNGFLNAGLRWAFGPQFYIELFAKDLLQNKVDAGNRRLGWSRELKFVYVNHL